MPNKQSIKTLTRFIVFAIGFMVAYTVGAIIFQAVTGDELSPTLTERVFLAFGGELLLCAFIKVFKIVKEN